MIKCDILTAKSLLRRELAVIKQLAYPKSVVKTVPETCTLEEALELLEEYGYRCVPVLDETGQIFRGNIYKMHIYRHKSQGKDMTLPVTHLLKNATKYIHTSSSFFEIFFMIKDLPYIAVLDEDNHFYGILTHASLINLLQQSWSLDQGSYVLTIAAPGVRGDLNAITKIVNRFSNIESCITLDIGRGHSIKRTIVTLEPGLDYSHIEKIQKALDRQGYTIVAIEDLTQNR